MSKTMAGVLVGIVLCVGAYFFLSLSDAWRLQSVSRATCSLPAGGDRNDSYVEFNINQQEPNEPGFTGTVFVNLGNIQQPEKFSVIVDSGSRRGFAPEETEVKLISYWNQVMMSRKEEASFIPEVGSHRDFPFDSGLITVDFWTKPSEKFRFVDLNNHTANFYILCGHAYTKDLGDGKMQVNFFLQRNPVIVLTATVLIVAAVIFVLVMPFAVKKEAIATSVASFFFSIWSLRSILSPEIKIFLTFLDLVLLSLSVLLLLLIGIRVILNYVAPKEKGTILIP